MDKGKINIDGVSLRLFVTDIKRKFAVTDSANSGRVQSYRMHRDIIGTFYNYSMAVEPDKNYPDDYDTFYDIISSPEESHVMVFPYGQETLEMEVYITQGEDSVRIDTSAVAGKKNRWSGLSIECTAMEPKRRP